MGALMDLMIAPAPLIAVVSGVATFLALMGFLLPFVRPDPMQRRIKDAISHRNHLRVQQTEALQRPSSLRRTRPNRLRKLVDRFKLREAVAGEELRTRLLQANWRGPNAVATFVLARLITPFVFGGIAFAMLLAGEGETTLSVRLAIIVAAVAAGSYLPPLLVTNAIQRRQRSFQQAFPDALDLLMICIESGLSIEAAFGRVAKEIGVTAPVLAGEFELTTAELAYLPDRRQALENLVLRTGLPSVKAVCTTLIQADKYGTPLATALRVAAQENRDQRMTEAEKKAAALPAKLTVPMIIFFIPALFVVILGPAFIQLMFG